MWILASKKNNLSKQRVRFQVLELNGLLAILLEHVNRFFLLISRDRKTNTLKNHELVIKFSTCYGYNTLTYFNLCLEWAGANTQDKLIHLLSLYTILKLKTLVDRFLQ